MNDAVQTALSRLVADTPRESEIVDLPGRLGRLGRADEDPPNQVRIVVLSQSEIVSAQLRARRTTIDRLGKHFGGGEKVTAETLDRDPAAKSYYAVMQQCEILAAALRDAEDDNKEFATADELFTRTSVDEREALLNLFESVREQHSPLKSVKDYQELAEVMIALGEGSGEPMTLLRQCDFGSLVRIANSLVGTCVSLRNELSSRSTSPTAPSVSSTPT